MLSMTGPLHSMTLSDTTNTRFSVFFCHVYIMFVISESGFPSRPVPHMSSGATFISISLRPFLFLTVPIKAFLRISYFPCELCTRYLTTKVFLLSTASMIEAVPSQNHYIPFCTLCYATISRGAPRPGDTSASLILRRRHVSFTKTKDARRRHVPGSASLCSLSWELSSRKVDKPCPW